MKGDRYLIEHEGVLKLWDKTTYVRNINRGIIVKYIGKVQHSRKKVQEPIGKKTILKLFEENIEMIANKGKENCLNNFKKLVYNKI